MYSAVLGNCVIDFFLEIKQDRFRLGIHVCLSDVMLCSPIILYEFFVNVDTDSYFIGPLKSSPLFSEHLMPWIEI